MSSQSWPFETDCCHASYVLAISLPVDTLRLVDFSLPVTNEVPVHVGTRPRCYLLCNDGLGSIC
jgi:hypothetical protein